MELAKGTVLHLIDTGGPGGAETIFLNLVTGLDPERWRSVAVVPERDWLWSALEQHGVAPVLLSTHGSFDVGYLYAIRRLIRSHKVRLIQAHLFSSSVYASLAAMRLPVPVVCTFHGRNDVADASYRNAKFRILQRRRNRCVFVSKSLRSWFIENQGVDPERAHVVYNGIDCERFRPQSQAGMRAELGVQPGELLIGAVGNLRVPKDYPTLLRAAALLLRRGVKCRFVIVGAIEPTIMAELEALRENLALGDALAITGFRNDIEQVMNALDIYVLSSSSEGFSLTTVQAMACGKPVVATRSGGPEEIVVDGETGTLVPTRSPDALADALQDFAGSASKRESLGRAARQRALACFSIESMIAGYTTHYSQCLVRRKESEWQLSS